MNFSRRGEFWGCFFVVLGSFMGLFSGDSTALGRPPKRTQKNSKNQASGVAGSRLQERVIFYNPNTRCVLAVAVLADLATQDPWRSMAGVRWALGAQAGGKGASGLSVTCPLGSSLGAVPAAGSGVRL